MIIKKATMSSSSQGFEFLDLSGVCDEDRQHLLSLFKSDNPAVVLLSSDVNTGDIEKDEDGDEALHQVPVSSSQSRGVTTLEGSPSEAETLPLEEEEQTVLEEYSSSPVYLPEGEYGVEGKVSVMGGSTSSAPPPPQVPSITSSTATTTSGQVGSSNVGTGDLAMREFSVPPPTVQGQSQVGLQQSGHQQVGPPVYHQPYPTPSPGNPPMYNPSMPPPSHTQPPPPSNVYSQMPPPVIPPPGATTVYVANCHVNVSPYNGAQVPVLASNAAPSQSPPPTPVMQSMPIMPEQNSVHMQPMKVVHDGKPEFENRRYDNFRGNHRGRGRARGRGRRNNERSNSVGSDHSNYGGEKHYPESMGPPQYPGPVPTQNVYYNVHYQMRGGGYPYANVPAAQVQGLPLMYSQPQYSQYMQYPAHSANHLLPYQQQSGTHGSQHPAAIHVHHQPPHQQQTHHPQPHPHHYQHHSEPPHMQHHPHEHQYQVDQAGPDVEQPIFPENPEIMSNVESEANSPFVSAPQTVPTQYESNSSVDIPTPVLNVSPSVTAAPEADRLNQLTTQASNMTLEETEEVAYSTTDKSINGNQQPLVTDDPQMINTVSGMANTGSPSSTCIVPAMSQQAQINDTNTSPLGSQSIVNKPLGSLLLVNQQPQMVLTQITKPKNEPKPCVSLNLEHTGISDITFMSDEIQPNVDPQDAVDFSLIPKPAVIPQNTTSSSYRVVPPLVSEGIKAATEGVSISSSLNIGNSVLVTDSGASISPGPGHIEGCATLTEVPKKNHVLPEMPANPQPGGAWAQKKSWSQLFKPCEEGGGAKQVAYVAPFNQDSEKPCGDNSIRDVPTLKTEPLLSESDIDKAKIGAMLRGYVQDHHQVSLQPRGLINKGYWCYVNAPLQALLACPPFYNLMKNVPNIAGLKKGKSTTPVIDSIVEYVHEFSDMAPALKPNKKDKTNTGARLEPEIVTGSPFEPLYVYKMLANMGGDMFTEGRQQDAEEMLSVVLNGLHDEMVESLKLAGGDNTPTPDNSVNGSVNGEAVTSDFEELSDDDEDEWQVMGPRKKSCVTRTAHITPSPISAIFWGQLRSVLHQAGGVTTANLQPFTTLPLDIQSPKVESVRDALEHLVSREDIPDYTCSKTNQEVTVCKQVLLETLPTVLILQLKRFIYDKDGGLQKITKKVNFPIDLEITKELMSPNSRGKFTTLQRKYKLLAVIYHDGKEANKGHYIADIYHSGYNCWLRYDDSAVKSVSESSVLRHVTPRVPYLLFYRRGDTLVGSSVKPRA